MFRVYSLIFSMCCSVGVGVVLIPKLVKRKSVRPQSGVLFVSAVVLVLLYCSQKRRFSVPSLLFGS